MTEQADPRGPRALLNGATSWPRLVVVVSGLAILLQVALIARGWTYYLYDFRAYYSGPHLFALGQDPYSVTAHLAWAASEGLHDHPLAFVYTPLHLWLFSPLAMLPYPAAFALWLGLQVCALAYVFFATVRFLGVPAHWAAPVLALGLNGTCATVLRSGQLTLMLLALLLTSIMLLQRNRAVAALVAAGIAAVLKVWVTPLMVIALAPFSTRRFVLVAVALGAVVALTLSGTVFAPELQARYQSIIGGMIDFGQAPGSPYNQSIVNILAYLAAAGAFPEDAAFLAWLVYCLVLLGASLAVCLPLALRTPAPERLYPLLFSIASLLLLLSAPRAIHYQWTLALPAAAFVLSRVRPMAPRIALTVMVMLPPLYLNRYLFGISTDDRVTSLALLPWAFWSYLTVLLLWLAALGLGLRQLNPRRP